MQSVGQKTNLQFKPMDRIEFALEITKQQMNHHMVKKKTAHEINRQKTNLQLKSMDQKRICT